MDEQFKKKAYVTKERDVRTHAELWHTSNCLLSAGQSRVAGSAHEFRASLVFRAFSFEAFLNWLGQQLIPHWKYLERLKPREKLDVLTDLIDMRPDYGARPWQIVKDLFGFRNELAHGKPENLTSRTLEDLDDFLDGKLGQVLQTEWERFCTEENAIRAKQDIEAIAEALYNAAGVTKKHKGPKGPFTFGFQMHGAEL